MTEQTQPTDAEIDLLISKHWPAFATVGAFPLKALRNAFREGIFEWGTPAGAVDPDNAFPLASKIYKRGEEWVLEVSGTINDCHFACRHTQPGNLQPEDVAGLPTLYTTLQPTQAQAGAVPLKYARLHAISLDYSDSEDECTGFRDGWRAAEKHHGIKGADHVS